MKTLVFRSPGSVVTQDAEVVEWGPGGPELSPDEHDQVDEAAMAWTKEWGRRPLLDGKSFRDLYAWDGVSLWWFAELYLHHSTRAPRAVRLIEATRRVLLAHTPDEVEVAGLPAEEAVLVGRTCITLGILYHGPTQPPAAPGVAGTLWRSRWNSVKTAATALKSRFTQAPRPAAGPGNEEPGSFPAPESPGELGRPRSGRPGAVKEDARRTVLFLSHAAFWQKRQEPGTDEPQEYEHYFDQLIPAVAADPALRPFVIAVGPLHAHRRRGVADQLLEWMRLHPEAGPYVHVNRYTTPRVLSAFRQATREARQAWKQLRHSPALQEAFTHQRVRFADRSQADLAGTLLLQWPWAVRSYEEMRQALESVRPSVVCLYAESSGWGRAAVLACRSVGVPTVAVQHGILYPKYYSYRRDPDEADSPRPDRTAVFGESARRILLELGRYAPESLVLTGSPKFDQLVAAAGKWDRSALRARLGVTEGERLLLVASRYQGIRDTHQSIGSAFRALLRAVEELPGVKCLVKPHPAEPATAYQAEIQQAGATRTALVAPDAELMQLMHAADALITVESLSAVEALVLGRPVLILNTPTNLRELVDAGAALGVAVGQDPKPAIASLLFDEAVRARLETARLRYLSQLAMGVDGGAAGRILELLRATALPSDAAPVPAGPPGAALGDSESPR